MQSAHRAFLYIDIFCTEPYVCKTCKSSNEKLFDSRLSEISSMSAESPIAHRTRGAGSYEEAAITGVCKICAARLPSMEDLWAHLRDGHPNDHVKRAKAMEAFPIAFQLDRLADCLPIDTLGSTPTLHSPLRPAPHMEARELWNRPEWMARRTSVQSKSRLTTWTLHQRIRPANF
ncbi:hypothetical protein TNCV_241081 [Trichonephila clavipes]|nr:hypothetical protein TNCV_241081 [Trichonephila clavipes]